MSFGAPDFFSCYHRRDLSLFCIPLYAICPYIQLYHLYATTGWGTLKNKYCLTRGGPAKGGGARTKTHSLVSQNQNGDLDWINKLARFGLIPMTRLTRKTLLLKLFHKADCQTPTRVLRLRKLSVEITSSLTGWRNTGIFYIPEAVALSNFFLAHA